MSKQYGLILPHKKSLHPIGPVKPSIFGADSDSDTEGTRPTGLKTALKRQDKLLQEKAVEEDPTVFQYDELYDEMDAKRKESKLSRRDLDKKPKYISKLLQSAERRKREYERRIERQVQKEREAEGEEFKDKESFVTSAYRTKLEEMKKLDEEEEREEYLEAIADVKKQGNLDGFYRHLYDQKVLCGDKDGIEVKAEPTEDENVLKQVQEETAAEPAGSEIPKPKKRKYRKRSSDSEQEPSQEQSLTLQHLPSNIDADSDFSIDSSDSDEENDNKKPKVIDESKPSTSEIKEEVIGSAEPVPSETKEEVLSEEVKVVKEVTPKIDIWKKRTVGIVFDEALHRYFERKIAREAGTYVIPSL